MDKNDINKLINNIEYNTINNTNFRTVVLTTRHLQLVLMSLKPNQDIGEEVHTVDQFFKIESGNGISILNGVVKSFSKGFSVIIPAGVKHNIKNTGKTDLKLYSIYTPPNHKDGTIHVTKQDAMNDDEKFDNKITIQESNYMNINKLYQANRIVNELVGAMVGHGINAALAATAGGPMGAGTYGAGVIANNLIERNRLKKQKQLDMINQQKQFEAQKANANMQQNQ